MYDVIVVGAGPAGCRVAELVAREGYKVLVLEEHEKMGEPVQCAGLVSWRIGEIPKKIILNKIRIARFCCKNSFFEVRAKRYMLVIDRKKYDEYRASLVFKEGAEIKLNEKVIGIRKGKVLTERKKFIGKIIVGADGPNSIVAREVGIRLPRNFVFGIQVEVASELDKKRVELWFGSDIAPNNFAWVIPENERVGRVGALVERNPLFYLNKFLERRFGGISNRKLVVDIIRYGLIKESVAEKTILVGDAACQVKPFSLGGIIYNQICAEYAAKACVKALEERNFSKEFLLREYDSKWKRKLGLPILKGMLIRKLFNTFQDSQLLFHILGKSKLSYLASVGDEDFL